MSGTSDEQSPLKDNWESPEQWRWAAKHVVRWGDLQRDDYDFRSWASDASDELLGAGCLYEYARESHKFRCFLVLTDERRKRERPGTGVITKLKGSSAGWVYLSKSGWETWLGGFTDELVANKSFAELHRRNRSKVEKSLDALPSYSRFPNAVELPGRYINYPRSQVVEIQIFFGRYTNAEIGEEMKSLAKKLRPVEWKQPQRRGRGKAISVIALLDALSAMRLRSHYPKRGTANAVDKFDDVRLGKIGGVPIYSDLDEYAGQARRQFAHWFPYLEPPANGITWAKRPRLNQ